MCEVVDRNSYRDQGPIWLWKKTSLLLQSHFREFRWPQHQMWWLILCQTWLSSVQSLNHIWLFATPWTAEHQASLSITNSRSLLKIMSIKLVMPSNHLVLWHPLLLLPSVFPSIRVFSSESVLRIRWLKYWSFNFSISPSSEYSGLISFRIDWFDLLAVQGTSPTP